MRSHHYSVIALLWTVTLLITPITIHAQDVICSDLPFGSCVICLSAGCAYGSSGSCVEGCSMVPASQSCFNTANYVGLTSTQVCAIADAPDEMDEEGEEEMNPASCPGLEGATDVTGVDYCEACLTAGCVLGVDNVCVSDCQYAPQDASCWNMENWSGFTEEEVCNRNERMPYFARMRTCGGCLITDKLEGQPCSWYASGYCGAGGCDMMGSCPVETCSGTGMTEEEIVEEEDFLIGGSASINGPDIDGDDEEETTGTMELNITSTTNNMTFTSNETDTYHPCNGFDMCGPCLNSRIECAWIANSCQPSCDVIADSDATCYHPSTFVNMTGPEICFIALQEEEVEIPLMEEEEEDDINDSSTSVDRTNGEGESLGAFDDGDEPAANVNTALGDSVSAGASCFHSALLLSSTLLVGALILMV